MSFSTNDVGLNYNMSERILIFDTSIATKNLGDLIILDSVSYTLRMLFPNGRFFNTPTHEAIGRVSYNLNKESSFSFVGGTNLLSSNMNSYNQWKVNLYDALFLRDIILMGVGWWQYQGGVNLYTKVLYKLLLNNSLYHSVRDSYTLQKLSEAGITNCINTGCPTTWTLSPTHCEAIPRTKSDSVVFTLTDYMKDSIADSLLVRILVSSYDKLYFWPQGSSDLNYLQAFPCNVEILAPTLNAFDSLLSRSESIDYVGTRLHAGIRALQHKRRSIIIGVDNRAAEMAKDINLPFLARRYIDRLDEMIARRWSTTLNIDFSAIETWRSQFVS